MKVLIVGCGRMGSGLAKYMDECNHSVTVVDKDPLAFENLGSTFRGRTILGVGFDRDILLSAGIASADALAAVTSSDEANVVISRIAKDIIHVPNVVARLYDVRWSEIYTQLGLQTVAPVRWGINRFAEIFENPSEETMNPWQEELVKT